VSTYVNVSGGPSGLFPQFSKQAPFCAAEQPFQTQVKLSGVFPLPWNLVTSATYQTIVYPQDFYGTFGGILATRSFTSAEIAPSLGRQLSTGASTALQMIPASDLYGDRMHQIDWRLTRNFNLWGGRIQPQLDIYNLFNDNPVLALNNTYGPLWQQPTQILLGRVIKFGVQASF
jgi:outer membrane receptor protein involved in Fe transport